MSVSTLIAAIAPALASDSRKSTFITIATQQTSRTRFGVNYEYAIALRACHLMARNPVDEPGSGGAVSSKSEGEISVSYQISAELQKKHGDLCSTPYGAQLAQLIEGNIVGQMTGVDLSVGTLTESQGNAI